MTAAAHPASASQDEIAAIEERAVLPDAILPNAGSPARVDSPASAEPRQGPSEPRRIRILSRLGLRPSTSEVVACFLDEGLPNRDAAALDAGCGRLSQLVPFRPRIIRFVGVDIHAPAAPLHWLDEFVIADLCRDATAFPEASFDLALASFTVEHFEDPPAAFRTIGRWLRPGGSLVITTVNRAHPFVNAYLSLPPSIGRPLQRLVKATAGDAHRLVGVCNTPSQLRHALEDSGYVDVEIVTTDHLARAWGRRLPTYLVGLIGDLAAHRLPSRRSTIVARARRPEAAG